MAVSVYVRHTMHVLVFALCAAFVFSAVGAVSPARADSIRDREYWLQDYGFTEAWNTTRGAGVTVAIIDTGIDSSVRDLEGAVIGGTDLSGFGSENGQTPVGSKSEHGTMVASLLAGRGNGGENGILGTAPEASLLSISVNLGDGVTDTDGQIADAIRWAVDNGADIINLSLTRNTRMWPVSWDEAFLYAYAHNVVVIAAAGNRGAGTVEVSAPATIPGVLTVAGVNDAGEVSADSSTQGITIGVSAPSEDLVGVVPGGGYVLWDGTSGAAPIVSGLAALVRSAHPELNVDNVINRITATAKPKGSPVPDPIYGYGLIDAAAAVSAQVTTITVNPAGDLAEWMRIYRPTDAKTPLSLVIPAPPVTTVPVVSEAHNASLPGVTLLIAVAVPVAVFMGFILLLGLFVFLAVQHFRRVLPK